MGKIATLIAVAALVGCATSSGGSFCDLAKPLRLSHDQVDHLTDDQVRQFLGHNERGAKLCGWKP
jgi:hypothetical protein